METLTNFLSNIIQPFLASYATTILSSLILLLMFGVLALLTYFTPTLIKYLNDLSEKHLSEKIHLRVSDALTKLDNVIVDLLVLQQNRLKDLAREAFTNDGKIDMGEVKEIAQELGKITTDRLKSERNTLVKYVAGEYVTEFIEDKISAITTQTVESLAEKLIEKYAEKK